ncbi:hypothetical protein [Wenzhouxiangella sediminis]|uniref:Periplasmic heavy metal sensor n=1 Tax=Wenzhouxiangella sediminis TaxID=1792836 RepID=A0A3E1K5K1_9GAMM|nr:hypothetical protein [Wenzhouxiangella sediminis]RFF29210.1 hypothetical protein DZC52_13975 [Wenzhouxiangella sediminis]
MMTSRLTKTIAGLALLCLSSLALARGPVDNLAERLDLDEQQVATITALFDEHRDYMHNEIQWRDADGNPDPEAREQVRAAREALHQEILAVLDEEQAARFEQMKEHRERRHARAGHDKRRGNRLAYALGQLDLSDQQKEAIQTLMAEHRAERMHERGALRSELASILTEEQLAELETMREAHRGRRNR